MEGSGITGEEGVGMNDVLAKPFTRTRLFDTIPCIMKGLSSPECLKQVINMLGDLILILQVLLIMECIRLYSDEKNIHRKVCGTDDDILIIITENASSIRDVEQKTLTQEQ